MKRTSLLGIALILAPLYGCATVDTLNPFTTASATPTPVKTVPVEKRPLGAPADLETAIAQAQATRKNGDLASAARMLSQLVLLAPDDARVLSEYGKTLASLGRSDDAIAFLERAAELQPADWSLWSAMGVAYDQKANYLAAQNAYARALLARPGEPSVLNNDALSHMQAGDLDGAERLLRQVQPDAPEFPRIAENLALVQSLKAARPAAAALAPVAAAPALAAVMPPPPAPVPAPAAKPAPVEAPSSVQRIAPPLPPVAHIVSTALEAPRETPVSKEPSALDMLKANPSVRMQPVPKDDQAGPMPGSSAPRVLPAKPEAPAASTAATKASEITADSKPATSAHATGHSTIYVQAGSYNTESRAGEAAAALDRLGARVSSGSIDGRAVFRVRIGPFMNMQQASIAMDMAKTLGRSDLKVVTE